MTAMTGREILTAFGESLDVASRWPRLLDALGYDPEQGRPGLPWINAALESQGFRPVLNHKEAMRPLYEAPYPDEWWYLIAQEVTGDRTASANDVIAKLRARDLASPR
jgi:hypothetical protein